MIPDSHGDETESGGERISSQPWSQVQYIGMPTYGHMARPAISTTCISNVAQPQPQASLLTNTPVSARPQVMLPLPPHQWVPVSLSPSISVPPVAAIPHSNHRVSLPPLPVSFSYLLAQHPQTTFRDSVPATPASSCSSVVVSQSIQSALIMMKPVANLPFKTYSKHAVTVGGQTFCIYGSRIPRAVIRDMKRLKHLASVPSL